MNLIRWMWLVAIGMLPCQSVLADLIIDDFTTPQSTPNVGGFGTSFDDPGIFGGTRNANLQVMNSSQQLDIAARLLTLKVTPGVGQFDNKMTLTYNDTTPSEDLGAANLHAISIADVTATAPWQVTVSFVGTNSPNAATRLMTIPSGSSGDLIIPFASFSSSVTDLGNISQISLYFFNDTGVAPQLSFGPITLITAVPEPSFIGAISLLAFGLLRCKHRRAPQRSK